MPGDAAGQPVEAGTGPAPAGSGSARPGSSGPVEGAAPDPDPGTPGPGGERRERRGPDGPPRPAESVVVTATVRLVAPFVLTLGLFTMFHGTSSVGGGFQGGVVVASMLVTVAFAFGVGQTWRWLSRAGLLALAVAGVLVFGAVAGGSLLLGESFLELGAYPVEKAVVYGTEAVELGIGATVAATVSVLFFEIAGAAADAGPSTGTGTGAGAGGRDDAGRSDGGTPPSGERRDAAGSDRGGAP